MPFSKQQELPARLSRQPPLSRSLWVRPSMALNSDLRGVKWSEITLFVPHGPRRPLVDAPPPPKVEAYFTAVRLSSWVGSGGAHKGLGMVSSGAEATAWGIPS